MRVLVELPYEDHLEDFLDDDNLGTAKAFWSALWASYIRNKGSTSLPYWAERFGCPKQFNGMLIVLKDWVHTTVIPSRNWGEAKLNENRLLTFFSDAQLTEYRKNNKYSKYLPSFTETWTTDKVRVNGSVRKTGLVREGFAVAAMTQYYYDTAALSKHFDGVVANTIKGMTKMRERYDFPMDEASYDVVAVDIVAHLRDKPTMLSQEGNLCDSRGRAIKRSLSKVANPIGYKDFRALLTIPE